MTELEEKVFRQAVFAFESLEPSVKRGEVTAFRIPTSVYYERAMSASPAHCRPVLKGFLHTTFDSLVAKLGTPVFEEVGDVRASFHVSIDGFALMFYCHEGEEKRWRDPRPSASRDVYEWRVDGMAAYPPNEVMDIVAKAFPNCATSVEWGN
jgi:hypothetical protein